MSYQADSVDTVDRWVHDSYRANAIAENTAAADHDFRVSESFQQSQERVRLIARRLLVSENHPVDSLVRFEPLLDKAKIRIYYKNSNSDSEESFEATVADKDDIEQLEAYRVNKIMYDKMHPSDSSCNLL